jgi:hypothetical protein
MPAQLGLLMLFQGIVEALGERHSLSRTASWSS